MEKNWERYAKVFGLRQVIDDGSIYPAQKYKEKVSLVLYITRSQFFFYQIWLNDSQICKFGQEWLPCYLYLPKNIDIWVLDWKISCGERLLWASKYAHVSNALESGSLAGPQNPGRASKWFLPQGKELFKISGILQTCKRYLTNTFYKIHEIWNMKFSQWRKYVQSSITKTKIWKYFTNPPTAITYINYIPW